MTRFAWVQTRPQTLFAAAALAAFALVAAITGVHLSHLFHSLVAHCHIGCALANQQFLSHDHFMDRTLSIVARVVPALLGMFWGAPLLTRELETGTFRLVWTQTVSRTRWTITKLVMGALGTVLIAGLLTLTITWWYRALDPLASNQYGVFDRRDVVPIGYALFGFAAGALIGAIVRRTVPAMATTLGVFIFARVAVQSWVRPHLLTPVTHSESLGSADQFGIASLNGGAPTVVAQGSGPPSSWTLSTHLLTAAGQPASLAQRSAFVRDYCPSLANRPVGSIPGPGLHHAVAVPTPANGASQACMDKAAHAFRLAVSYLPGDRYWTLQWLEAAVFVGLALLSGIGCFWWVTRRTN